MEEGSRREEMNATASLSEFQSSAFVLVNDEGRRRVLMRSSMISDLSSSPSGKEMIKAIEDERDERMCSSLFVRGRAFLLLREERGSLFPHCEKH